MRLFPCAALFGLSGEYIWRWPRVERFGAFGESSVAETDRVREVGNYVHSWRPLYGFGVCLSLRLWYRCLRRSCGAFVYRIMLCFLRRYNTFGRDYVFARTTCRACDHVSVSQPSNIRKGPDIIDCLYRHLTATNKPMHAASIFIIFAFQSRIRLR